MGLLESVGASVKAVAASLSPAGNTPFSNWGTGLSGSSSASGYLGAGAVSGMGGTLAATATGSRDDYSSDVGDVSLNGVVSAGVSAIAEAFCSAPFVLEQFSKGAWNRVDMHPCIELLYNPNPHYGRDQLWEAEIAGEIITGNGYMRVVWNQARTQPVELWHESLIAPVFDLHHFIGSYRIFVDGRPYPLAASALHGKPDDPMKGARIDHALHFRYRLNRRNPRFGESPLICVFREIAGDNIAATYQTAVLKNGAGASFFLTPKEGATLTTKQMEEILSQIERRLRREGAGRVAGSNLPVDFHKVSFSPDELALDRLPGHYEARICAALKVPPMILGLGAGDDHKTYSNFGESVDDFWQRNIIPFQNRKGAELEAQLFPLFDMDKSEWRIGFDRSQIAALQDDEGALYERLTKAVGGVAWMTRNEAREKAKYPALPEMEEESQKEESDEDENEGEMKSIPNWEESEHPRVEDGKFGKGGKTVGSQPSKASYIPLDKLTPEIVDKYLPADLSIFQPQGSPVASALTIEATAIHSASAGRLASALAIIDSVHGDGKLPLLKLYHDENAKAESSHGEEGYYKYESAKDGGEPKHMNVALDAQAPELTTVHETAHFLDHKGLVIQTRGEQDLSTSGLDFSKATSKQAPEWQEFHAAIKASQTFQSLAKLKGKANILGKGKDGRVKMRYKIKQKQVKYLLKSEEIFARAYCQYIATRSGDPTLRQQIASRLLHPKGATTIGGRTEHDLNYPEFWSPKDFEPVAKALDDLFINQGWMA